MKQRSPHGQLQPCAPCIPRPEDVPPAAPGRLCSGRAGQACCSRGEVILSLGGQAPRRNPPGLHLGADVTHPAGLLPARPPVGSSKGHIPGCSPLPHHLVESPGRPWGAGAAGRAAVQGEGLRRVLGGGGRCDSAGVDTQNTLCKQPQTGGRPPRPWLPHTHPGPRGGPSPFPE